MHKKKKSKQKKGSLGAVQTRGRMLMYKNDAMQTIHLSQVLLLIQWSQVKITMRIASFQSQ